MPVVNKSSLNNILKSILSVANKEANMAYPPSVFSDQFNTVTSLLLSELVKRYPTATTIVDMLNPFMVFKLISVTDGYIKLPDDYRDLLGSPAVVMKPDETELEKAIKVDTEQEFKLAVLKAKAVTAPLNIVDRTEWDYRVTSTYKVPTLKEPIGQRIGNNRIQVAPFDIGRVYVLYAKKESIANFGYILNPDDTYFYDPNTSTESEWDSNAFSPIFTAMMSLYSAYTRDKELIDWSMVLKSGIL